MRTHRICPSCQRGSYVQDASHCPYCGTEYQAPAAPTPAAAAAPTPVAAPAAAAAAPTPVAAPAAAAAAAPTPAAAPAVVTPVVVTPIDSRRWWSIMGIILGFVVLIAILIGIIWGGIYFFTRYNPTNVALNNIPKETTSAQTNPNDGKTEGTTQGTTEGTTSGSTNDSFKPKVANGETISANKEFQVKAGDVVSGDVYYVTADDVAVPIMDDDSTTALIVYFTEGARLRTGDNWSVYLVHQPSQTEIDNLIAEKQKENFERVDYILFPETQKQSSK